MFKSWTVLVLVLATLKVSAQDHPYIADLRAQQVQDRILVEWTTKAGFSCQDIMVQLSSDSVNFSTKATYYGLCGDTTEKRYSLFIDKPIVNALNYIRLDLGQYGYSDIISVKFILQTTVQVHPNPVNENSIMYLNNSQNDAMEIFLFNSASLEQLKVVSRNDTLLIYDHLTNKGMYFYTVYRNGVLESRGKFIF